MATLIPANQPESHNSKKDVLLVAAQAGQSLTTGTGLILLTVTVKARCPPHNTLDYLGLTPGVTEVLTSVFLFIFFFSFFDTGSYVAHAGLTLLDPPVSTSQKLEL